MPIKFFRLFLLWMAVSISAACESGASSSQNIGDSELLSSSQDYAFTSPQDALQRSAQLQRLEEDEEALALLAAAYRLYPQESAVISAYARLALAMGRNDIAAEILPSAVSADSQDWRALSAQGVLYGRAGKLPEALDVFAQAQNISSSDPIVLNNLAIGHLLDGRPNEAVRYLRQALAATTASPLHRERIKGNLAFALAVTGQFPEADQLAGEPLPRRLYNADPETLRQLMGVSARAHLAQINASQPPAHAEKAPPFDPFSR